MKRITLVLLVLLLVGGMAFAGGGGQQSGGVAWEPTRPVEFIMASDPGGGNDIFTRAMIEILTSKGISKANFTPVYNKDGGGEVSKQIVVQSTGTDAAYRLLGTVSGDLPSMIRAGNFTMDNFIPIAVEAGEKQIVLVSKDSKYKSIDDVVGAIKSGQNVSLTAAGGDDELVYLGMLKSLNVTKEQLSFVPTRSNAECLTLAMGGHMDICISKLAASKPYLESGDLVPLAVASSERFTSPPFNTAPTFSELGYPNVEYPMWRSIWASANMPKEAVEYYARIFKEMSQTPEWQKFLDGLSASRLDYFGEAAARQFIMDYEKEVRPLWGL